MPKPINLIVSCAENRVIAHHGRLPWRLPEDLKFFRDQTAGQIVLLGRKSFQAWPGAARRHRRPIVVTNHASLATATVLTAPSLSVALAQAESIPGDIYVCGGQRLFEEAFSLPQTTRLYLTLIHAAVPGDRLFPEWRTTFSRVISQRERADGPWHYTFFVCERAS